MSGEAAHAGRTRARERALQVLYRADLLAERDAGIVCGWAAGRNDEMDRPHFESLVRGVLAAWEPLGDLVGRHAHHWSLTRMAVVDRTILRIGAFELISMPGIPGPAVLDEAVALARRYGDAGSYAFVNGILDGVHREVRGEPAVADPAAGADAAPGGSATGGPVAGGTG